MRLQTEKNEVEVEGITRTRKFSIAATGKAFKILSDGLYSNKIKAIIRELSCNAYDSHIENGYKDKPFQVHLPNKFNPLFLIRDYGVGLSPRELETLYTTYFQSTKNNSNDLVGCLGLGSKSPFSYTDNFTVTSWKNNQKHIYSCYLDEYSEPNIAHIKSIKSDEPSGVQIEFSVKASDFSSFRTEAESVFKYFDITPEFTCGTFPSIVKPDYNNRDWVMTKAGRDYYNRESYAVMGNVAYPLSSDSLGIHKYDPALPGSWLLEYGLIVKFPIGALNITPSRESLGYNEATKQTIIDKLQQIEQEIADTLKKEINSCSTLWEARIKLTELSVEFNCGGSLTKAASFYKGEPFVSSVEVRGLDSLYVRKYVKEYDKIVEEKNAYRIQPAISLLRGATGSNKTVFIFNHDITLNKPLVKRAKEYFTEHLGARDVLYTVHYVDGYVAEKLVEELGLDESQVLHAEDVLPKKKKQNSSSLNISGPKIKPEKITVLKYISTYSNRKNKSDYWGEVTIDASQLGGYYVPVNRYSPEGHDGRIFDDLSAFHWIKHKFEQFYSAPTIFGIRKPDLKKAQYNPNLTNFWKFLKAEYDAGLTSDLFQLAKYSGWTDSVVEALDCLAKEFPNSEFSKYKQLRDTAKSSFRFLEKMQWLHNIFNRHETLELPINLELEALPGEILKKYPLLQYIPKYASDEAIKYVKLVQAINP